jgi:hypothetical protein
VVDQLLCRTDQRAKVRLMLVEYPVGLVLAGEDASTRVVSDTICR